MAWCWGGGNLGSPLAGARPLPAGVPGRTLGAAVGVGVGVEAGADPPAVPGAGPVTLTADRCPRGGQLPFHGDSTNCHPSPDIQRGVNQGYELLGFSLSITVIHVGMRSPFVICCFGSVMNFTLSMWIPGRVATVLIVANGDEINK